MPAEDEFRKVAEDVRELARTLQSELRTAKWQAKDTARQAKREWRAYYRSTYRGTPHREWDQHYRAWYAAQQTPPSGAPPYPPTDAPVDPTTHDPAYGSTYGPASAASGPTYGPAGTPAGPPVDGPTDGRPGPCGRPPAWAQWATRAIPRPGDPWARHSPSAPGQSTIPPPVWYPRPARAPKPPKARRPERPPLRHKRDGSTLISLLLVILGLAWLVSATGVFTVSLEAALAIVLAVLGAVMVVTARTDWGLSRSHWPVWLGLGLLVVLLVSANGNAVSSGLSSLHFGPVDRSMTAWPTGLTEVSNLAGPVEIDMSNLAVTAGQRDATVRVRNTFGPVRITLPPSPPTDYTILINAHTAVGPVNVPGTPSSGGTFTNDTATYGTGGPTITLDIRDAFGPVDVSPPDNSSVKPVPDAPSTPTDPPTPGT